MSNEASFSDMGVRFSPFAPKSMTRGSRGVGGLGGGNPPLLPPFPESLPSPPEPSPPEPSPPEPSPPNPTPPHPPPPDPPDRKRPRMNPRHYIASHTPTYSRNKKT